MGKKKKKKHTEIPDKHTLYSAAVQSVDADLDFFRRIYRRTRGRPFRTLREDFCGTAMLACEWVRRHRDHRAWGVDLHRPTLDFGIRRYVSRLGRAAERLELRCQNVLETDVPPVDVVAALNFSYCVFKQRALLLDYFRKVHASLLPEGILFLDIFGGTEAVCENVEKRKIDACRSFDGTKVPAFTYVWEQARYNPVDNNILCYIHFKLRNGVKIRRAFRYDWRLWTIPELREILEEAGFESSEVYVEGWEEDGEDTDGIFRRRTRFENQVGWVAYVVGYKAR